MQELRLFHEWKLKTNILVRRIVKLILFTFHFWKLVSSKTCKNIYNASYKPLILHIILPHLSISNAFYFSFHTNDTIPSSSYRQSSSSTEFLLSLDKMFRYGWSFLLCPSPNCVISVKWKMKHIWYTKVRQNIMQY